MKCLIRYKFWARLSEPTPSLRDTNDHFVALAYVSDLCLIATVRFKQPSVVMVSAVSINHVILFHHPTDFNDWHLLHIGCDSASGSKSANISRSIHVVSKIMIPYLICRIYNRDGVLIATALQEGFYRKQKL